MGARYRFATDRDDRLLAIEELPREARHTRAPYRCIGCDRELIPKMGSVVAHHFAHKYEQACAGETYLHRLAKLTFIENYQRCLAENRPFILSWTRTLRCNHFQGELGFSCSFPQVQRIDLTREFDLVELELEREGFRADVLLHSSQTQKRLFIEFVVTHQSSPEKRSSGIPIIEVEIEDEDHAVAFARDELDSSSPSVKLFNFKKPGPGMESAQIPDAPVPRIRPSTPRPGLHPMGARVEADTSETRWCCRFVASSRAAHCLVPLIS